MKARNASYWRCRAVAGSAKKRRQSVSPYGALIGTRAQCHIAESGVKHKVRSKLYYDDKSARTNGFLAVDRTGETATAMHETAK
jgi:hypothetical protein